MADDNAGFEKPSPALTTPPPPPAAGRNALVAWFASQDLDNVFAYSTIKIVTMRDRYLGLLHYAFQLAIFIYIIVFVIIVDKGYLQFDAPTGSVQYTARRCTDGSVCAPVNMSSLPYCSEPQKPKANVIAGCRMWDEFEAVQGLDAKAFYAVTRTTDTLQSRNASCVDKLYGTNGTTCSSIWVAASADTIANDTAANASWAWVGSPTLNPVTYYIPQVENISLKLDHNINALSFLESDPENNVTLQGTSRDMNGTLKFLSIDRFGRILDFIGLLKRDRQLPAEPDVFFTLGELFSAAGVPDGLEKTSEYTDSTLRYDGTVLILVLTYTNTYPAFVATGKIKYEVKVFRIRGAEFKYEYAVPITDNVRIKRNTHGVRILFVQQGKLGKFSFQVLLVQLVSALALLKVASTIVDLIALQLLPHKGYYKDLKYQVSRDFSDLRDAERRRSQGGTELNDPELGNPDDSQRMHADGSVAVALNVQDVADGDEDGTEMVISPEDLKKQKKQKKKAKKDESESEQS